MKQTLVHLISFLASLSFTDSSPLHKRQTSEDTIEQYITQVRTVVYVLDSIRAGGASSDCSDSDLPARLDGEGYAGQYAQTLLCEVAVGIAIFQDVDLAEDHMNTVLEALQNARESGSVTALRCDAVDVDTLDDAGLNGTRIRDAVCENVRGGDPALTSTTSSSSSTSSSNPVTTTSSTSSQQSPTSTDTDVGLPTFNSQDSFTTIQPTTLTPTSTIEEEPTTVSTSPTSSTPASTQSPATTSSTSESTSPATSRSEASASPESTNSSSSSSANTEPMNSTSSSSTAYSTSLSIPASSSLPPASQTNTSSIVLPPISATPTASSSNANATNVTTVTVRVTSTVTFNVTTTLTPTRPPWYWPGPWQGYPTSRNGPYGAPWGVRYAVTGTSTSEADRTTIAAPSSPTEPSATKTCTEE